MENASKALLMAAGVLIAIMVLSMGVYLYTTIGTYVRESQARIEQQSLDKFNAQFYNYQSDENEVFSFQDVVTVANIAYENNCKYEFTTPEFNTNGRITNTEAMNEVLNSVGKSDYVQVSVTGNNADDERLVGGTINLEMYVGDSQVLANILKKNYKLNYKCTSIEINADTKKVCKISFEIIE